TSLARAALASPNLSSPAPVEPTTVTPVVGRSKQIGPHGQTTAMASGFGKLWVTAFGVPGGQGVDQNALIEVDPDPFDIVETVPVPTVPGWETGGGGLLASGDSVWITGYTRDGAGQVAELVRVDPDTGATQTYTWPQGRGFGDLATDGTALWLVGSGQGSVH